MTDLTTPEAVKRARHALGLTVTEMALALELVDPYANGRDTVRAWEKGKREISGPARVAIRFMLERAGLA